MGQTEVFVHPEDGLVDRVQDTRILGGLAWGNSFIVGPCPPRLPAIVLLQIEGHTSTIRTQRHMPPQLRLSSDSRNVGELLR
jgi:hypothetical protein